MRIIRLLEQLANKARFQTNINDLIKSQSIKIKEAILSNDAESLKKQISDTEFYPNGSKVVHL